MSVRDLVYLQFKDLDELNMTCAFCGKSITDELQGVIHHTEVCCNSCNKLLERIDNNLDIV